MDRGEKGVFKSEAIEAEREINLQIDIIWQFHT